MKITKKQLKRIIKEEYRRVLSEAPNGFDYKESDRMSALFRENIADEIYDLERSIEEILDLEGRSPAALMYIRKELDELKAKFR